MKEIKGKKIIGGILMVVVLALVERVGVAVSLVLPFIVVYAFTSSENRGLVLALVAGLVVDLMGVRGLGISSLVFLGLSGLAIMYRQRFAAQNWLFLGGFGLVASIIYSLVIWGRWGVVKGLVEVGMVWLWRAVQGETKIYEGGIFLKAED